MIDTLKMIESRGEDAIVVVAAAEMRVYLETNFKSKPNYVKNKSVRKCVTCGEGIARLDNGACGPSGCINVPA